MMKTTIEVGDIKIGNDQKPFIISEIGSNWTSLEDCIYSVRMAKWAGADAVKFQLFDWASMYGVPEQKNNPLFVKRIREEGWGMVVPAATEEFEKYCLSKEWIPRLAEAAKEFCIEFMCSAFSPELLNLVDPHVRIHKVASAEMYHVPLLRRLNQLDKPVIMSTAASTIPDISSALMCLHDCDVVLMYCVGAYPAKDIDLRIIPEMARITGKLVGYSDHSTDVRCVPMAAVWTGACIIEKHMTAIEAETPDSPHSLNPEEFKKMVQTIRGEGDPPYIGPTSNEKTMIMKWKRRLKVIKPIKKGEKFIEGENFGAFRSLADDAHAISPFHMGLVEFKVATRDLNIGDGIGPGDF